MTASTGKAATNVNGTTLHSAFHLSVEQVGACTGCPKKNDPSLQCHIFKDIGFDVFKFSTVIQHGLK